MRNIFKVIFSFAIAGFFIQQAFAQSLPSKGAEQYSVIAPNNTTGIMIKSSAGLITDLQVSSIAVSNVYLKLYDKAIPPTCGTDTPVKRILIPVVASPSGDTIAPTFPWGIKFNFGIGYCLTLGIADSDTTPPVASTVILNIGWN